MEREIANVAAACAMRGFRYLAFPPIVFDAPLEPLPTPTTEMERESADAVMDALLATMAPEPAVVEPVEAARLVLMAVPAAANPPSETPPPQAAPTERFAPPARPQLAALAERIAPPPSPAPGPAAAPLPRRFALLADVSAEIRRQAGP